jgi:hypothetical protein
MTRFSKRELPADLKAHFGSGASFDLSLELGPAGDQHRGNTAIERLWTCANIVGPWFGSIVRNGPECQFGILEMPDGAPPLPFIVHWIQERRASDDDLAAPIQFGIQTQEPSDWLPLGIPVRALRSRWPVDGSWRVMKQPWLSTLCSALVGIADHIYAGVPFYVGVMGEEASGCWRRPTPTRQQEAHQGYPPLALLSVEVIEERGGFLVSPDLWAQLAPVVVPGVLPSGLLYVAPRPDAALLGA